MARDKTIELATLVQQWMADHDQLSVTHAMIILLEDTGKGREGMVDTEQSYISTMNKRLAIEVLKFQIQRLESEEYEADKELHAIHTPASNKSKH